jgi:hypothetical protein
MLALPAGRLGMRLCFLLALDAAVDAPRPRLDFGGRALDLKVSAVDSSLMVTAAVSGLSLRTSADA